MDQRILLNRAISKSGGVAPGTEFLLKDLFDGVDWSNMKVGEPPPSAVEATGV